MAVMKTGRQVFRVDDITLAEAVERVPFTILVPRRLPWPGEGTEQVWVRYFHPIVPGYFAKLAIIYWYRGEPTLYVHESDTSPTIDVTVGLDFSEPEYLETGGRALRTIKTTRGGYYGYCVAFEHERTHVVIYSQVSDRQGIADLSASFEALER